MDKAQLCNFLGTWDTECALASYLVPGKRAKLRRSAILAILCSLVVTISASLILLLARSPLGDVCNASKV